MSKISFVVGLNDYEILHYLRIHERRLSLWIKNKVNLINCTSSILGGSLLFFLLSNFGVWFIGGYEKSFTGLITCYTMAIPFF